MDFLEFKQLLDDNNIYLSDGNTRIAHFRFNNLTKILPQKGGGTNLLNKLKFKNKCLVRILIDSLVNNNKPRIKYIIDSFIS